MLATKDLKKGNDSKLMTMKTIKAGNNGIAQTVLVSLILVAACLGIKGMRPKQTIVHNFMIMMILVLIMMCWN